MQKSFVNRPWGGFIKFINNKTCTVKILLIKKNEKLSLQVHKLRKEFWYVAAGKIKVTFGKNLKSLKRKNIKQGGYIDIPKRFIHTMDGLEDSQVLEISTGKFKESDEIRIKDK
jgi:mannose-6-phosphate isomerase-like protein (cupin superfamily)